MIKTLIAIPCNDMVQAQFLRSVVGLKQVGASACAITVGTLVHDARNQLAKQAVDGNFDRVLWLDSDMTFDGDLMEKLSADMDEGREFVTGLYFKRKPPYTPVIYSDIGMYLENGLMTPKATGIIDYPKDDIFPIKACGFGACMVTVDLIKRVGAKYGAPFGIVPGFGEDMSFCMRVDDLGVEMFCDSRIKLGHVGNGVIDEDFFMRERANNEPS